MTEGRVGHVCASKGQHNSPLRLFGKVAVLSSLGVGRHTNKQDILKVNGSMSAAPP
jgi:hypothetical protein